MCKYEAKGRVFEVRLVQLGGSSYGMGGRGMRSLRSGNFSNPRTSRDWLQLEPLSIILRLKEISPCVYKTYNLIKTPFLFMKNLN